MGEIRRDPGGVKGLSRCVEDHRKLDALNLDPGRVAHPVSNSLEVLRLVFDKSSSEQLF